MRLYLKTLLSLPAGFPSQDNTLSVGAPHRSHKTIARGSRPSIRRRTSRPFQDSTRSKQNRKHANNTNGASHSKYKHKTKATREETHALRQGASTLTRTSSRGKARKGRYGGPEGGGKTEREGTESGGEGGRTRDEATCHRTRHSKYCCYSKSDTA